MAVTEISTTRFGAVGIEPDDVLFFPDGLLGLEESQRWVLLADAQNATLGWLQSTTCPEMALAVVSPRRFVPDYQIRLSPSELTSLAVDQLSDVQVLVVVGKNERGITLNLKAPVLLHLRRRLGRQVINNVECPVQYELDPPLLKKIA